jgi:hypothetical protein
VVPLLAFRPVVSLLVIAGKRQRVDRGMRLLPPRTPRGKSCDSYGAYLSLPRSGRLNVINLIASVGAELVVDVC